uniref:NET domain-containing protein n=1 Tax=viral metagenome TaxID=1070528 RepID=A0A6C0ED45_9ZZZZ
MDKYINVIKYSSHKVTNKQINKDITNSYSIEKSEILNNKIDDLNIFLKDSNNNNIEVETINHKNNNNRKYNSLYRKKLISKFDNIKNKNILLDIYNIIINDIGNNYSSNRNGIFININIVSDLCIEKLNEYIDNNLNNTVSDLTSDKIDCKIYKFDDIELISEMGHKLSNQEKNIIKRIRKTK